MKNLSTQNYYLQNAKTNHNSCLKVLTNTDYEFLPCIHHLLETHSYYSPQYQPQILGVEYLAPGPDVLLRDPLPSNYLNVVDIDVSQLPNLRYSTAHSHAHETVTGP